MDIKVLILSEHKLMRQGLSSLFEKLPEVEVVAQAENGFEAERLVEEKSPGIVIVDTEKALTCNPETTHHIVTRHPNVKVIALSMNPNKRFMAAMMRAGASGYLLDDCAFGEVKKAIHTVMSDQVYVSPSAANIMVSIMIKDRSHRLRKHRTTAFSNAVGKKRRRRELSQIQEETGEEEPVEEQIIWEI